MVGRTISHYKILAQLGAGGMGVVYKAEDTRLHRPVALKFLPLAELAGGEAKERFEREARAAAALDHPNICTIYEIDEIEGRLFIAMAFLEGETVQQRVERSPLKIDEALDYAIQTAKGLAAAHEKGIVHRDIKSANLMVTHPGAGSEAQIKIMDFGLAQLTAAGSKLTAEGSTLGTTAYMSPEQTRGEKVDARTDIWSLGVVLYETIAGQLPFLGEYQQAVIYSVLHEEPEPLTALRSGVGIELERIVHKALAKDPDERYQTALDFLADLRTLLKQRHSGVSRVRPAARPTRIGAIVEGARDASGDRDDLEEQERTARSLAGKPAPESALTTKLRGRRAFLIAVAAVILIAAGLAVIRLFRPAPGVAPAPMEVRPLTSFTGTESFPAFSPDGNQVAFTWDGENQDNVDLYVRLVEGGTPLRLTADPAPDSSPAWSPDNRYIAFLRHSQGTAGVYLVPPIGGLERKLAEVASDRRGPQDRHLAWTPDGKMLAVTQRGRGGEPGGILLLSIDTGETTKLLTGVGRWPVDHSPAFSPDGQRLAFVRQSGVGSGDIYWMPVAAGEAAPSEPRRVTFAEQQIHGLAWTPDSQKIVFGWDRGSDPRLWSLRVDDPASETPLSLGENVRLPAIAQRGERLAYARFVQETNIWGIELGGAAGKPSEPAKVVSSTRNDYAPQFSPDGRRIAFQSDRSGGHEIWIADSDGSNPIQLTTFNGPRAIFPRWSPDGRWIVFQVSSGARPDIYVVAIEGRSPRRLTSSGAGGNFPSWSSDGRWIYFSRGPEGLWKMPFEEGPSGANRAVRVEHARGGVQESPDGEFLYYRQPGPEFLLLRVPVAGSEGVLLPASVRPAGWASWVIAEQGVYFVDDEGEVKLFNPANNQLTTLASIDGQSRNDSPPSVITVSPDGRRLLYDRVDRSEADLMLAENFQ